MDQPPTVLIVGATGKTGCQVMRTMSQHKDHFNLVAGVYKKEQLTSSEKENLFEMSDRIIDLCCHKTMDFRGIDYMFIVPSSDKERVTRCEECLKQAKHAGVKYILLLSVLGAGEATNSFTKQFRQIEQLVQDSDIPCSFLRCSFYMENLLYQTDSLAQNKICLPLSTGHWNPVALHDVSQVVCSMLMNPSPFQDKSFDLVGPKCLSGNDIAKCFSTGLKTNIQYHACSQQEYQTFLLEHGCPEWQSEELSEYLYDLGENKDYDQITSDEFFKQVTGGTLQTLHEWIELHLSHIQTEIKECKMKSQSKAGIQEQPKVGFQEPTQSTKEGLQQPTPSAPSTPSMTTQPSTQKGTFEEEETEHTDKLTERLKHLLHELITERASFNHEEELAMKRNQERLNKLFMLEKNVKSMKGNGHETHQVQSRHGQQQEQGMGQQEQGMGGQQGGMSELGQGLQKTFSLPSRGTTSESMRQHSHDTGDSGKGIKEVLSQGAKGLKNIFTEGSASRESIGVGLGTPIKR